MRIEVEVWPPYPCGIMIKINGEEVLKIPHTSLLQLEHAVAEAKRLLLCNLDRRHWHEVDPKLAGN